MPSARLNYWVDILALSAGVVVFATGSLLLTRFHMGDGAFRGAEFGVSRLVWVNIHRFGALVLLGAVAIHVQFHWRTIVVWTTRAWRRLPGAAKHSDLALYGGFLAVAATALIAWFLAPGSPAAFGPILLERLPPHRHIWIDLHNLSGMILLPAAIIHVRKHVRWIARCK